MRVPAGAFIQPILSDDVVAALADIAVAAPVNGTVEVGGPERFQFNKRKVVADAHARYFGTELAEESLVPIGKARLRQTRFDAWAGRTS